MCGHNPVAEHKPVPKSIDSNSIVSEWRDDNTDGGEYDGDHDDDEMSRQVKRYLIEPL